MRGQVSEVTYSSGQPQTGDGCGLSGGCACGRTSPSTRSRSRSGGGGGGGGGGKEREREREREDEKQGLKRGSEPFTYRRESQHSVQPLNYIYGTFDAKSTRLKPSLFFLIQVCHRWPQKKPTPSFRFF